jgi:membrane protein YqaA with SNARE-associated domain
MGFFTDLTEWVLAWAHTPYSTVALAALAFAESSFFPVPPDTLLITLGLARPETALALSGVASVASVAGGVFGYYVGRYGGRPLILRMFGEEKVAGVQALYRRYDVWAVFFAAFTPLPYKVFTIGAGVFALDLKRFILASFLGRSARFFLVGLTLTLFGDDVQYYLANYLGLASVVLAVLLVAGFLALRYIGRLLMHDGLEPEADRVAPPSS